MLKHMPWCISTRNIQIFQAIPFPFLSYELLVPNSQKRELLLHLRLIYLQLISDFIIFLHILSMRPAKFVNQK